MSRKNGLSHWVLAGVLLAGALMTAMPASAQRSYYGGGGGGGFFGSLFGGGGGGGYYTQPRSREYSSESSGDYSRAPSAKKSDTTPTTSVMVMGDSMADWLAYGLEEAFADAPEIGIQRRHKTYSGLIRYEARTDLDWSRVARELLAKDKTDVVVMMLGTNDRQAIRETAADRKKNEPAKPAQAGQGEQTAQTTPTENRQQDDDEAIAAPEPHRGGGSSAEVRSERWEQIYTKRIDEMIAALKS
jgi:lysophospholipase L1-like esterase